MSENERRPSSLAAIIITVGFVSALVGLFTFATGIVSLRELLVRLRSDGAGKSPDAADAFMPTYTDMVLVPAGVFLMAVINPTTLNIRAKRTKCPCIRSPWLHIGSIALR